jgi:arginine/ornithine transport system substrate-binding protein
LQSEFDALIPALRARKFDAIVASMSITPERRKSVDFSTKCHNSAARFVARQGAGLDISPEALKGKTIGVQRGTGHR